MPVGEYGSLAAALTEHLSNWTNGLSDKFVAQTHIFQRSNEGRLAQDLLQNHYQPMVKQAAELQLKQAHDGIKSGAITGQVDVAPMIARAQRFARQQVAGPKDYRFVTLVKSVHDRHGQLAAESLSNAISFSLKDYADPAKIVEGMGKNPRIPAAVIDRYAKEHKDNQPYSPFKTHVQEAGVPISVRNRTPSYVPSTKHEAAVMSALNTAFAPMIAIPHIGTIFNGMLGTTPDKFLSGAAHAMSFSLDQEIDKHEAMMITGAFAEHHAAAIEEWNRFKATGVPAWRQAGPNIRGYSAAHLAYKVLHQPGFRPLRDYTLLSGVNAAQMTVTDLAAKFAKNPQDKHMMYTLNKWGLNPNDIIRQNGVLDQGQLERSIYRFVDEHYFLDNTLHRSAFFQGTPAGRILGMYHSYVTRQAKLMAKSIAGVLRGQGIVTTARNIAVMATVFPVVGEIIKLSQMAARGQDVSGTAQDDWQKLAMQGDYGIYDSAAVLAEAFGHMGSFGIYNHLLRGGYTHSMLNEAVGPTVNSAFNLAQDTINLVKHRIADDYDSESLGDQLKPIGRDISYDIPGISTLSYFLSHRILPKDTEDPDQDPAKQLYNWFQSAKDEKPKQKQNETNQQ